MREPPNKAIERTALRLREQTRQLVGALAFGNVIAVPPLIGAVRPADERYGIRYRKSEKSQAVR